MNWMRFISVEGGLVLVIITWWEAFSKRVGAPAALGLPYAREEKG